MYKYNEIAKKDSEVADILIAEEERTAKQLKLIPSENYVSPAVREALSSGVMNKYSEGQVKKRYYRGNKYIDQLEILAKERALELFDLDPMEWDVCVQAVTGSVANLAVYNALLEPGDKIMGMFLYDGGHLSHGWKLPSGKSISFTSKVYESHHYHVDADSEAFDYDQVAKQVEAVKPQILISGGTAYPRAIDHSALYKIAQSVGAYYMADVAHEAGLIAAGVHPRPFEYADVVTMTTRKTLRGPVGSLIFSKRQYADDIARSVMPGLQGGPLNHSIAGIAVALGEAMKPEFKQYGAEVIANAKELATQLTQRGYRLVSGGTDKHLMLIDLTDKGLDGDAVSKALERANIIVNKNTIPGETKSPWKPSGIRIGTPSITTRGMGLTQMVLVAEYIDLAIQNYYNRDELKRIAMDVEALCAKFDMP